MKTFRIIFFGSDEYSLIVLNQLLDDKRFKIVSMVTTSHSPVENSAQTLFKIKFTVRQKGKPSDKKFFEQMRKLKPDVGILASFGKILPKEVLRLPKHGILNLHPSLLPKYRGPSPVQTAILNGDKTTGLTIIKMDEKIDHGPIVSQFKEEIKPDDTAESLYQRLFAEGAEVLKTILPAYVENQIELKDQDHKKATYTKKLARKDGFIPPEILGAAIAGKRRLSFKVSKFQSFKTATRLRGYAVFLERFIRAMYPWPGAWTKIKSKVKRLKILKAHLENGKLVLNQVQLEGKKPVSWKQFQAGYPKAKLI